MILKSRFTVLDAPDRWGRGPWPGGRLAYFKFSLCPVPWALRPRLAGPLAGCSLLIPFPDIAVEAQVVSAVSAVTAETHPNSDSGWQSHPCDWTRVPPPACLAVRWMYLHPQSSVV